MRTVGYAPREGGAVAIMFIGGLLVIIGFCGLALDLSRVYNRKMEMQSVADTAALAAVLELDGTSAGISRAVQKASARFTAGVPSGLTYDYSHQAMDWSDAAIEFGTSSTGPWLSRDAAAAKSTPNDLLYVKVETGRLNPSYGEVTTLFMPIVSRELTKVSTGARAVAGRSGIAVTPLAICAMRPEARRDRHGELEEYGFRRGVSYDLMQLDPTSTSSGQSFLIHPFAAPGATGTSASDFNTVAPFVCTGTMAIARVKGGEISVTSPFPIGILSEQFNSRFDSYTPPCSPDSAPPDTNIKQYTFNDGSVPWMSVAPDGQAAALYTGDGKRWTVAGPDPTPAGTSAGQYGPLWSYAKAVRYADPPPAGAYTAYATTDWNTLYFPGEPQAASGYPGSTPYSAGGVNGRSPSRKAVAGRRVLNVALLSCPVSGSKATVLGIGRFFMTVRADTSHLYAEFAGLAEEQTLRAQVRLYP
jgi:Flp pilus assembly protein TadG